MVSKGRKGEREGGREGGLTPRTDLRLSRIGRRRGQFWRRPSQPPEGGREGGREGEREGGREGGVSEWMGRRGGSEEGKEGGREGGSDHTFGLWNLDASRRLSSSTKRFWAS